MRTEKFVVSCVLWFVSLFASASDPMPLAFEKTPLNEVIAMFSDASGIEVELPSTVTDWSHWIAWRRIMMRPFG